MDMTFSRYFWDKLDHCPKQAPGLMLSPGINLYKSIYRKLGGRRWEVEYQQSPQRRLKQREHRDAWDKNNPDKVHDGKKRRDYKKRGNGIVEVFSSQSIFERDGWICGICRQMVERNEVVPHPRAPTIDHIVPLAKGGIHRVDNVQCACFMCNSLKRDVI